MDIGGLDGNALLAELKKQDEVGVGLTVVG